MKTRSSTSSMMTWHVTKARTDGRQTIASPGGTNRSRQLGGGRCYLLLRRLAHARAEHDPKILTARGEDHAVRGDLRRSRRDRAEIAPRSLGDHVSDRC